MFALRSSRLPAYLSVIALLIAGCSLILDDFSEKEGCESDADCKDDDPCTDDICEKGFCQHELTTEVEGPFQDASCSDFIDNDCDGGIDMSDEDCWECEVDDDCADDVDPCTRESCTEDHTCEYVWTPRPGEEGPPGDPTCSDMLDNDCDDAIDGDDVNCVACNTDDECDDENECTTDECASHICTNPTRPDNTPCGGGDPCYDYVCLSGSCSELENRDRDADLYDALDCGGSDCDDGNAVMHPDALEVCGGALDEDCDGLIDEADLACAPALHDRHGFFWENPRPVGHRLEAVWVESAGNGVWAVGPRGTVLKFDGSSWELLDASTIWGLRDVYGFGADSVWVVGEESTAIHWDGSRWAAPMLTVQLTRFNAVWGVAADDVWIVGDAATILHGSAAGMMVEDSPGAQEDLHGVHGNAGVIWVVGDNGAILQHDGSGWLDQSPEVYNNLQLSDVWVDGDGLPWIVGKDGVVLHHDGAGWTDWMLEPAGQTLHAIWGSEDGTLFVSSSGGEVHVRILDGSWEVLGSLGRELRGVFGASDEDVWVVGDAGVVGRWYQNHLHAISTGCREALHAIHGQVGEPVVIWAVGAAGTVLVRDDERWADNDTGTQETLRGVWTAASRTETWVAGDNGTLLSWDGASWSALGSAVCNGGLAGFDLQDVWGYPPGEIYIVGGDKACYRQDTAWFLSGLDEYLVQQLSAVWGAEPDWVWAVGSDTDSEGVIGLVGIPNAFPQVATHPFLDVWGEGPDYAIAVGEGGALMEWKTAAWEDVPHTHDHADIAFHGVWGTGSDEILVVGSKGLILKYDGINTSEVRSGAAVTLESVWGFNEQGNSTFWIAGENGAILRYEP